MFWLGWIVLKLHEQTQVPQLAQLSNKALVPATSIRALLTGFNKVCG